MTSVEILRVEGGNLYMNQGRPKDTPTLGMALAASTFHC